VSIVDEITVDDLRELVDPREADDLVLWDEDNFDPPADR
jgi:hypothetical protein